MQIKFVGNYNVYVMLNTVSGIYNLQQNDGRCVAVLGLVCMNVIEFI